MKRVEWRWSTESARWQTGKGWEATKRPATLYADGNEYQKCTDSALASTSWDTRPSCS